MIPPYYCPTCDRFDMKQHDHDPSDAFVVLGLLALVGMFLLLILYVLGLIP